MCFAWLQPLLLLAALAAVPWMLVPKPYILRKRHMERHQHDVCDCFCYDVPLSCPCPFSPATIISKCDLCFQGNALYIILCVQDLNAFLLPQGVTYGRLREDSDTEAGAIQPSEEGSGGGGHGGGGGDHAEFDFSEIAVHQVTVAGCS